MFELVIIHVVERNRRQDIGSAVIRGNLLTTPTVSMTTPTVLYRVTSWKTRRPLKFYPPQKNCLKRYSLNRY